MDFEKRGAPEKPQSLKNHDTNESKLDSKSGWKKMILYVLLVNMSWPCLFLGINFFNSKKNDDYSIKPNAVFCPTVELELAYQNALWKADEEKVLEKITSSYSCKVIEPGTRLVSYQQTGRGTAYYKVTLVTPHGIINGLCRQFFCSGSRIKPPLDRYCAFGFGSHISKIHASLKVDIFPI